MEARKWLVGFILSILVFAFPESSAATYYVSPGGDDNSNGLSWENAFATIQKGIDEANDGDASNYAVVEVSAGTYITKPIIIDNNYVKISLSENTIVLAESYFDPNTTNSFLWSTIPLIEAIEKKGLTIEGKGTGAYLKMRRNEYPDIYYFNAANDVDIANDSIRIEGHMFPDNHYLIYKNCGYTSIGGLQNDANYLVDRIDANTIKLKLGGNYVNLTSKPENTEYHCVTSYPSDRKRHIFNLLACKDVNINNLTLQDSGGDGIYIGSYKYNEIYHHSENVTIESVLCKDYMRNGISIIDCDGLNVFNFKATNSDKKNTLAGIFIESNEDNEIVKNNYFANIVIENIKQHGIVINFGNVSSLNDVNMFWKNISVSDIEQCEGLYIKGLIDNGPNGVIGFNNMQIVEANSGIYIQGKSKSGAKVIFENCGIENIGQQNSICFSDLKSVEFGDIDFINCQVFDNKDRPSIKCYPWGGDTLYDIKGDIHVYNKFRSGSLYDWSGVTLNPDDQISVISGISNMNLVQNVAKGNTYSNIQEAINDAKDGDLIRVWPGIYYENINFNGKQITLSGHDPNDWNIIEATIIDANNNGNGITFDTASLLQGFTIRNSNAYGINSSSSAPVIEKCIIKNNNVGIYASDSGAILKNNKIFSNTGSGINYVFDSSPVIKNNLIYSNGAGITCGDGSLSSATVANNTIVNNENYGVQVVSGGSAPAITNCILWNNNDDLADCNATYSCIQDGDSGTGNISSDPCLADAGANDFHLGYDSPCIDAGYPNGNYSGQVDIDNENRVVQGNLSSGSIIDMGADEIPVVILPAHMWKLDDGSGTTALDSAGDANGTIFGNEPDWIPGKFGGAVDLGGTSSYFAVSSLDNSYTNNDISFTVSGWFKTSQSTGIQTIVGNWSQNENYGYSYYNGWEIAVDNNKAVVRIGADGELFEITGTTNVNDGQWHHFAFVYRAAPSYSLNNILYVDGNEEGTPIYRTMFIEEDTKFRIGDGNDVTAGNPVLKGGPFNGVIDEVRMYNQSLTAEEVKRVFIAK